MLFKTEELADVNRRRQHHLKSHSEEWYPWVLEVAQVRIGHHNFYITAAAGSDVTGLNPVPGQRAQGSMDSSQ